MKKLSIIVLLAIVALAGKCYYAKAKVNKFLEALREYGYSYKVKKSSICSMDIELKITDAKKIANIYPKFMQNNKKFMTSVTKSFSKINQTYPQEYKVSYPIFGFNIVAKNSVVFDSKKFNKSEIGKFYKHLSDNKLVKSVTTCNIFGNSCFSKYDDIDTNYNNIHIVVKNMNANITYKSIRSIVMDYNIGKITINSKKINFTLDDFKAYLLYADDSEFDIDIKYFVKKIEAKNSKKMITKIDNLELGMGYFENGKKYFNLKNNQMSIKDKSSFSIANNLKIALNISKDSTYIVNLDKLKFNDFKNSINVALDSLNIDQKLIDNNIYINSGKSTLKSFTLNKDNKNEIALKDISLQNIADVKNDILNLHYLYDVKFVDINNKKKKFKIDNAKLDLAINKVGYGVIRDFYNDIKQVYKKVFIASFNGYRAKIKAKREAKRETKALTLKYMPRVAEIFKNGIEIKLKDMSFKELAVENKIMKKLNANLDAKLKKITLADIVSKKYNNKNLPLDTLNAKAKIPNQLLQLAQINEAILPFKFINDGELKVVNITYKDKKLYINNTLITK